MVSSSIDIHGPSLADRNDLLSLFNLIRPSVAGTTSPIVYRAFLSEFGTDSRAVPLIAQNDMGRIVGYVVAIRDWHAFWRSFLRNHGLSAAVIAYERLRRRLSMRATTTRNSTEAARQEFPRAAEYDVSWQDTSPRVAKILHIAVVPEARGQGVGGMLYNQLFDRLRRLDIERVDARIDEDNVASYALHLRTGWQLLRDDVGTMASIRLTKESM